MKTADHIVQKQVQWIIEIYPNPNSYPIPLTRHWKTPFQYVSQSDTITPAKAAIRMFIPSFRLLLFSFSMTGLKKKIMYQKNMAIHFFINVFTYIIFCYEDPYGQTAFPYQLLQEHVMP